jgi:purine-binding chemotaxis protein CheW
MSASSAEVLDRRARELARAADDGGEDDGLQLVVLEAGGETFGIDVLEVEAIAPAPPITPVPACPAIWLGVVNLRGVLYPVLDGARHLAGSFDQAGTEIALLSGAGMNVALLVHRVVGVRRVEIGDVKPTNARERAAQAPVRALTSDLLPVVDVEAMLLGARAEMPQEPDEGGEQT